MQRAFPSSKPDADRDEYRLQLTKLAVDPISREEAGDNNPASGVDYVNAVDSVTASGENGTYNLSHRHSR